MDHSCILSIPLAPGICEKWLQNVLLFFSQPRARGGPPSNMIASKRMEKIPLKKRNDKTSSQRKTHDQNFLCSNIKKDWHDRSSYESVRNRPNQKSRLNKKVCSLPTAAHFHSDKIPTIRTSPLSLFVFIFGREDNPRQSRIRSLR